MAIAGEKFANLTVQLTPTLKRDKFNGELLFICLRAVEAIITLVGVLVTRVGVITIIPCQLVPLL